MNEIALPRIGIRLSSGLGPRYCIDLAQAAEANGFASIWFAENPFESGVFVAAGACAAMTGRMRLGIGVVNPYTRHPVQIAMEFAALDELSGGRAILGIGSGIAAPIKCMGLDNSRPVTAVREAITIVCGLMMGDGVTFDGTVFNVRSVNTLRRIFPHLPHPGPQIYLAAAGQPMLRACGELADGLVISNLTPLCSAKRMAEMVVERAAKLGRPKPTIVQYVPCVAHPIARRHARRSNRRLPRCYEASGRRGTIGPGRRKKSSRKAVSPGATSWLRSTGCGAAKMACRRLTTVLSKRSPSPAPLTNASLRRLAIAPQALMSWH